MRYVPLLVPEDQVQAATDFLARTYRYEKQNNEPIWTVEVGDRTFVFYVGDRILTWRGRKGTIDGFGHQPGGGHLVVIFDDDPEIKAYVYPTGVRERLTEES